MVYKQLVCGGSSVRAVSTLDHSATSPTLTVIFNFWNVFHAVVYMRQSEDNFQESVFLPLLELLRNPPASASHLSTGMLGPQSHANASGFLLEYWQLNWGFSG